MIYEHLTPETESRILSEKAKQPFASFAFDENNVIRRNPDKDKADVIRTAFIRDCDKIIHCPFYNRYADKTQVFSFYKNDDIIQVYSTIFEQMYVRFKQCSKWKKFIFYP